MVCPRSGEDPSPEAGSEAAYGEQYRCLGCGSIGWGKCSGGGIILRPAVGVVATYVEHRDEQAYVQAFYD